MNTQSAPVCTSNLHRSIAEVVVVVVIVIVVCRTLVCIYIIIYHYCGGGGGYPDHHLGHMCEEHMALQRLWDSSQILNKTFA